MKIKSIQKSTWVKVETDNPDYAGIFYRESADSWWQEMGESLETEEASKMEPLYQNFIKSSSCGLGIS